MTTNIAEKNILKKSQDGSWYSIAPNTEGEFIKLDEAIQNTEMCSSEWWEAHREFNAVFGECLKEEL